MVQTIGSAPPTRIESGPSAPPVPPTDLNAGTIAPAAAAVSDTATTPPSPTRVVVEPGESKFVLVFKVLDNATGDVLTEIPHQTPQQAAQNPNYSAGALINQKV